jgi:hypothetical protein
VTGRRDSVLAIGGMGLASFVLAHDILYLAEYGADFRSAMARTGHGEMWAVTVVSAIAISLALVTLASRRLQVLGRIASGAPADLAHPSRTARWAPVLRSAARTWLIVALVALVFFVMSENWERYSVGMPLPGLSVLLGTPPSLAVMGIFASVAALVASVATLYRRRYEVLAWRARMRRSLRRPGPLAVPRADEDVRPHPTPLACRIGGRAPPAGIPRGAQLPVG